jgi:hypothetical protein
MPKPVTVDQDAQPNVATDGPPPAQCNFNHRHGPPQNNTFDVGCAIGAGLEYHLLMKVATGTVVKGTIIVHDPEFKDGTDVFILTRELEETVRLSPEELADLEAGIAEANRGEMIPGDEFFAHLRRYG